MQQIPVIMPIEEDATGVFDAGGYEWIIVSADNLQTGDGDEEVDIENIAGSTFGVTADESGTAKKLTPTIRSLKLAGCTIYKFSKDATQAACGVYVQLGPPTY